MSEKPKHLMDVSTYSEAWNKLQALRNRQTTLSRERQELESTIQNLPPGVVQIKAEALAMVSGGGIAAEVTADKIRQTLGEIDHETAVISEAIMLQEKIVQQARADASKIVCHANRGEWEGYVREIGRHLKAMLPVVKAERAMRIDLEKNGVVLGCNGIVPACPMPDEQFEFFTERWMKEFGNV